VVSLAARVLVPNMVRINTVLQVINFGYMFQKSHKY
jgi:hypothetical protein